MQLTISKALKNLWCIRTAIENRSSDYLMTTLNIIIIHAFVSGPTKAVSIAGVNWLPLKSIRTLYPRKTNWLTSISYYRFTLKKVVDREVTQIRRGIVGIRSSRSCRSAETCVEKFTKSTSTTYEKHCRSRIQNLFNFKACRIRL